MSPCCAAAAAAAAAVIGCLAGVGILAYLAFSRGLRLAAWCFITAVLCMFGMSAMGGSVEQTVTTQWVEESINTLGQIAFAVGCWLLYKNYRAAVRA